jgi:hypothetical protein
MGPLFFFLLLLLLVLHLSSLLLCRGFFWRHSRRTANGSTDTGSRERIM